MRFIEDNDFQDKEENDIYRARSLAASQNVRLQQAPPPPVLPPLGAGGGWRAVRGRGGQGQGLDPRAVFGCCSAGPLFKPPLHACPCLA